MALFRRHPPYTRTTHDGLTVNWRTKAMLLEAESAYGSAFNVLQGSYNAGGVGASAGTHDGGGAVDIAVSPTWRKQVNALRKVGFAAWHREALPGTWGEHIHAIAMGDKEASQGARNQMIDYKHHLDGLADGNTDLYPYHPNVVFDYPEWQEVQTIKSRIAQALRRREKLNANLKELRRQLAKH